jgi:hypothetical protein
MVVCALCLPVDVCGGYERERGHGFTGSFSSPLSVRRHWHAFHHAWIANMAVDLNEQLPAGYFAEPNAQFGIEIDVATFEEPLPAYALPQGAGVPQSGAEARPAWIPPAPSQTIPFSLITDLVECWSIATVQALFWWGPLS